MRFGVFLSVLSLLCVVCVASCSRENTQTETTTPLVTPPVQEAPGTAPGKPPVSEPPPELPEQPTLRFVGRFDDRDVSRVRCGWPGCRILASFEGVAVSARLDEAVGYDGPSEWDVAIDGEWKPKIVMKEGPNDYALAADLPPGKHTVELYKRTESQSGVTAFLGFDFHGGKLLAPPPRASRLIEIVGDSDVAGYGYEGAITGGDCENQPWLGRYQNFRAGWGQRLADKLRADLAGTVFSGKGFVYNAWRPDLETIDVIYPRANPEDPTSKVDVPKYVPDAIVVAIGGNDFNIGAPTDDGPAPLETFTQKVRSFTTMLRSTYPKAHVFLMVYAALDESPPGRERRTNITNAYRTVATERKTNGDAQVHLLVPTQYTPGELNACSGHGGPTYHERIATYVAGEVGARLGWK